MERERPREPMEPPGLGRDVTAEARRPQEADGGGKTILSVRISVDKCRLVVKNAALSLG